MNNKTFKCTFLSDIVLSADTATEGSQTSLDYIPGSCFLGIVAKNYDNVSDAYTIFHSGKVRFGDGHIAIKNKRLLKQPAAWFCAKDDANKSIIYLHHLITEEMKKNFAVTNIQLKQVRLGYFHSEVGEYKIEHDFSMKSAYDSSERRSADGQLYGYDSLRKGSQWIFSVDSEDVRLLDEVTIKLLGEHNIGRSKTAQYGRVKIELLDLPMMAESEITDSDMLTIYFESCAAFIDNNGNPTYQPANGDLGLIAGKINWEKSQILTKTFAPWNDKRKTRDADRTCIDKGSVIVVENGKIDKNKITAGVGLYRNEGFGKIIVNPHFLQAVGGTAQFVGFNQEYNNTGKHEAAITAIVNSGFNDSELLGWIKQQAAMRARYSNVVKHTNLFMAHNKDKFKGISASQWGSIRERAQRITKFAVWDDELFKAETGYLRHGKTENKWRNIYEILRGKITLIKEEFSEDIARRFLINLCSEMAKQSKEGRK